MTTFEEISSLYLRSRGWTVDPLLKEFRHPELGAFGSVADAVDQQVHHEKGNSIVKGMLKAKIHEAIAFLKDSVKDSREKLLAITRLEEGALWADVAVDSHGVTRIAIEIDGKPFEAFESVVSVALLRDLAKVDAGVEMFAIDEKSGDTKLLKHEFVRVHRGMKICSGPR